jgi:hypothetical protein
LAAKIEVFKMIQHIFEQRRIIQERRRVARREIKKFIFHSTIKKELYNKICYPHEKGGVRL